MSGSGELIIGCCTALLDRPALARLNMLQVAAQTVQPSFHSIVARGTRLDERSFDDLIENSTLFSRVAETASTLDAYTLGMDELWTRGVNVFFCLDHDCVYKRRYIEAVCEFIYASGLDADEGLFCLNLVDQQWITLYEDASGDIQSRSFRNGLGLSPQEAGQVTVGAPPTFVFGRGAAGVVIERARRGHSTADGYQDIFWRRALLEAGIRITQVSTPEPVFAYVRHANNLCWGGRVPPRPDSVGNGMPFAAEPIPATGRNGHAAALPPEVSIVIPTYNEGAWLARTVESIKRSRTDARYEIVVVDDGCTDGSVHAVAGVSGVRVVPTGGEQLGLIVAKNTGARASRSRYLCFVDSHMLVHDYWLDYLRETCDGYPDGALVSGNLPDVTRLSPTGELDRHQYGYMIRNCFLGTGWHFYGCPATDEPYLEPLTPGGLMFTKKVHFARLGGFDSVLRKWGAEDIQISLQNYCLGGENVVDPRVVLYHYYKYGKDKKRTFIVTNPQHAFNCLHVAAVYFPYNYYWNVREAVSTRGGREVVAEIENDSHRERREKMQTEFIRGFDTWVVQFAAELRGFLQDAEERSATSPAPYWEEIPAEVATEQMQ